MTTRSLTWQIKRLSDRIVVSFAGSVDETADFDELMSLSGDVTFDLAGISQLSSDGVRRWIHFLQRLTAVNHLDFVRCSPAIVEQLNMIRGMEGSAEIRSFYAPYICHHTGEEQLVLLNTEEILDPLRPPAVPGEAGEMVLDDDPERYLGFLLDLRGSAS